MLCCAGVGGLSSVGLTLFLGENTLCEITDTANGCVMTGGSVSRFRIKCDSTVP